MNNSSTTDCTMAKGGSEPLKGLRDQDKNIEVERHHGGDDLSLPPAAAHSFAIAGDGDASETKPRTRPEGGRPTVIPSSLKIGDRSRRGFAVPMPASRLVALP